MPLPMIPVLQCGTGRHQHNSTIHRHLNASKQTQSPLSLPSPDNILLSTLQDHCHGGQDMALVQWPPSLFFPFLQLCWPSECLLASPRETAERSPKAVSCSSRVTMTGSKGSHADIRMHEEVILWCSHGNKTLGSPMGCVYPRLGPGWV